MRLLFAALLLAVALPLRAQPADAPADPPSAATGERLVAAVAPAPPFVIQNANGTWDGIAVELWREVGRAEGFEAALREVPADEQLGAVARGEADVALAVPATPEAERLADFALPYYTATLGVARPQQNRILDVLGRLFSPTFGRIALGLAVLLLVVGLIEWAVERKHNSEDFREDKRGIWDGFYWAGVTMTTIGYGDVAPRTAPGRAIALFWMLVSMAVTAALTAALVSALGLGSGASTASLPSDVRGETVGVVEGTVAAAYLDAERVRTRPFSSVAAGIAALKADSVDAFVGSMPVVEHVLNERGKGGLQLTQTRAEPQAWAFAVAPASPRRERLSRAVLDRTNGPAWQATLERYLGSGS